MSLDMNLGALTSSIQLSDPSEFKKPSRLEDAAKQFEALMITQMMKTARETSGGSWLSEGDETGEDTSMGMAEQQFAQSMANNGGLGLAKMVVKTMSKPHGSETTAAPAQTP